MDELNLDGIGLNGIDKALQDRLKFFVKLLNTDLKVLIDFFSEIGLKLLLQSEEDLKKEFKNFLDRIPKPGDLP